MATSSMPIYLESKVLFTNNYKYFIIPSYLTEIIDF